MASVELGDEVGDEKAEGRMRTREPYTQLPKHFECQLSRLHLGSEAPTIKVAIGFRVHGSRLRGTVDVGLMQHDWAGLLMIH